MSQEKREPFIAKAGRDSFVTPSREKLQTKMTVNKPGDRFEQEADAMADKVMRMPAPGPAPAVGAAAAKEEKLQRRESDGSGPGAVGGDVQSAIQNKTGGGEPLGADVRGQMESRFNADFGNVRIHKDAESATLNNQLSARAFTYA